MSYEAFIATKLQHIAPSGMDCPPDLHPSLFPHQRDLTKWALRRGRAAIFASTGLGKTAMEIEWAGAVAIRTAGPVLILAPLAVAAQTVREGERLGVTVTECRSQDDVKAGVNVTNYERLHKFDAGAFSGVVLDESSIIKHHEAKTLRALMDAFAATRWRLCATATPAPNDWSELGTHAEFLGICSRAEMLSEFFVHDGGETQTWRLKGHAVEPFWRWVASWGALVSSPADLGYDASQYELPPLTVTPHVVSVPLEDVLASGRMFADEARTLMERRQARRTSMSARVAEVARLANASAGPWVIWCDLNAESQALASAIDGAVEVTGAMPIDEKESRLGAFGRGEHRAIVTKPSIAGFGLNWQHVADVAFCGVTDSWEAYYQAIRRCWRFGQKRPVNVHIVTAETEGAVVANIARKEADAKRMAEALSAATRDTVRENVQGARRESNPYAPNKEMEIPEWLTA